jgi:mono/diheme cytochrome c family protein
LQSEGNNPESTAMTPASPRIRRLGIAVSVGLAAGFAATPARADAPSDLIAKGKYLATMGDCQACHTASGGTPFAGGLEMDTPFGKISTPNITPDKATGIGDYTDQQFIRVFHAGIRRDGAYLYPVMPFPWYAKVTDDDVLAIKAYLFSLPPVTAPRKPLQISFPFNIRTGLGVWDAAFLHEGVFKPDPSKSDEVNRGAYIVEGLEHCGECHDSRNMLGAGAVAKPLQGGEIDHWFAPNITSDVRTGIGRYSDDQLVSFLKTGTAPGVGTVVGPMAQTVHDSLS